MLSEILTHSHAILVHFPIAVIVIGLCYDVFHGWRSRAVPPKQGMWLWVIAALSAWLSVATGPEEEARGNTAYLSAHSTLANITAWAVTLLVVWRIWRAWRGNRPFAGFLLAGYLLLSIASCALVLGAGYYGGKMVYSDGIGVQVNGTAINPPKARPHR
ncbi:DUF2231 domain-containing protein [Paenibacillus filicis]|uniref:DUF2231 domain-containing protein n=1 Tax=Paenibacillus filicis TaxID=669464 RepID=A0ABU9DE40_9BACL